MISTTMLKLALRNLARHRRRSLIAIGSVAFGIAALIVATGFMEGMFLDFREATIQSQYSHIQVKRPGFEESGRADPYRYLLPGDAELESIAKLSHVKAAVPRLILAGLASKGDSTVSFIGEAILPGRDLDDPRSLRLVAGRNFEVGDKDSMLLGRGLAESLGAKVGDRIVLLVNTPRGGLGAVEGEVKGIFNSVSKAYDDSALLIPIPLARSLMKVQGAHTWRVYLDQTELTDEVAGKVRSVLDPKRFQAQTWDQLADFYMRSVDLLRQQLGVLRVIVVAIILLGIGNTMMMSVLERTGEIGTIMALGLKRRVVLGQFLSEGVLVGLLGGAIGVTVALVAALILHVLQIDMPPPPGLTRGYVATVLITPSIVLEAMLVAVGTTAVATLYPAWRASRMLIVDAIRASR